MRNSSIPAASSGDFGKPSGEASAGLPSLPTEASLIGRFVAILTPVFAIVAGWVAGLVAQWVPGAHLDQNQIVAFMTAAAAAALAAGWKWLQGWQQHEALVSRGLAVPVRPGPPLTVPATGTTVTAATPIVTAPTVAPTAASTAAPTAVAAPGGASAVTTGGTVNDG